MLEKIKLFILFNFVGENSEFDLFYDEEDEYSQDRKTSTLMLNFKETNIQKMLSTQFSIKNEIKFTLYLSRKNKCFEYFINDEDDY